MTFKVLNCKDQSFVRSFARKTERAAALKAAAMNREFKTAQYVAVALMVVKK